ncbi:hypothetical protein PF010_g19013 [Phytophthora fragariae]|uniref:Uncharacterized protein n=2 Tax=Phytophthora fragariae TaxID=53985 RepID=A0A6A4CNZ1_9STRA|nr:hypothetical protein PF009_g20809 [Phytophthora fragariae]KAE8989414.1 hypothetical protein PF011_g18780 [Phytophthora fragariae]KAE9089374.1 hypothetical protein PF010_g19013 [Phytophthora fragariae]KAE9091259.1 hypothetical protein PF007_g18944 [Phytophthora fragariae]KAE9201592.1 hypothetical protein PF004_g18670 [Phytophthora fragariae]
MASTESLEVEGVTTFSASPWYRYILELTDDKLTIWMENQSNKSQWFSCELSKNDFVSSKNALPCASAVDYVKCLQQALDSDLSESSDVKRELIKIGGGSVRLEVTMEFRSLCSTWTIENKFELKPGTVKRIHSLEMKVREQREMLEDPPESDTELKPTRKDASSNVCLRTRGRNVNCVGEILP